MPARRRPTRAVRGWRRAGRRDPVPTRRPRTRPSRARGRRRPPSRPRAWPTAGPSARGARAPRLCRPPR
ncbi:MAG: hypothetical protein B7X41_13870 [Microbacterium sp. 14-71-5]|nr:MAG: hypothetical protein B7X41_13870 [Microbacterium sp. 14-71-5]